VSEAEKQDIKEKKEKNRQTKINKENKNLSAVFSQEHTQMF
jgi:hypothetical protein